MMLYVVPTSDTNVWYTQTMTFGGDTFILEMRYNTRMSQWFLSLYNSSETLLVAGIPVVIDTNLCGQYAAYSVPVGTLFAHDNTGNENQPVLASFLTTHNLYYLDQNA